MSSTATRWSRWLQGLRFLVVGGLSTVTTVGSFNLLVHVGASPLLGGKPLTGYTIGMVLGMVVAYVGNTVWVFDDAGGSGSGYRRVLAFAAVNVVCLLLPLLALAFSRYVLGASSATADNIAANVVGLVLATAARYVLYRFVVFAGPRGPEAA